MIFASFSKLNYSHKHVVKPQFSLTKEWTDLDSLTSLTLLVLFANNKKKLPHYRLMFLSKKKIGYDRCFTFMFTFNNCAHLPQFKLT